MYYIATIASLDGTEGGHHTIRVPIFSWNSLICLFVQAQAPIESHRLGDESMTLTVKDRFSIDYIYRRNCFTTCRRPEIVLAIGGRCIRCGTNSLGMSLGL